jgi:hypothetical protein
MGKRIWEYGNCNVLWFAFLFGGRGGFGDVERKGKLD